ncbi:D-alanyl-D-alanine carboxypeptidase/D-alanyl-D-alanine endopeptidase [Streptomyces armeniacus]|uniref:D-alanyl-D-alanine carboxypeptidase/D-alanyl-D-alanine endopeptidase n=1 Tax=Streptomyces armeniacus TaxID=83291 RepID=UPI0026B53E1E
MPLATSTTEAVRTGPSAPGVLTALGDDGKDGGPSTGGADNAPPPPTATGLADSLRPLLKDPALGPVRTASVVDVASGKRLFDAAPDRAVTPASTVKLATAIAALSARGADHRIATRAVRGEGDRVVLVGGGDPTMTAEDLDKLAKATAKALTGDKDKSKSESGPKVSLGYDTSLYSGPVRHGIGPNENLAPVTPLMVNEARLNDTSRGPAPRSADPARDAADAFAESLSDAGVDVSGKPAETKAPKKADRLAVHHSAPMSALVERMLTHSDNDIGEALARQTAVADGAPVSFAGAGDAVRKRLAKLGLRTKGTHITDGSGLDRAGKVPAELLTRILVLAADPERPKLRSVLTGLPIAGFSGTLDSRYADAARGAGLVRAKTGTLTGVNTLAGSVVDADGRLLVFAFMTTGTTDRQGAQKALDKLASSLANCGCR